MMETYGAGRTNYGQLETGVEKLTGLLGRFCIYFFLGLYTWELLTASFAHHGQDTEWQQVVPPLIGMTSLFGVAAVGCFTSSAGLLVPGMVGMAALSFWALADWIGVLSTLANKGSVGDPSCLNDSFKEDGRTYYENHKQYCGLMSAFCVTTRLAFLLLCFFLWRCVHGAWWAMEKAVRAEGGKQRFEQLRAQGFGGPTRKPGYASKATETDLPPKYTPLYDAVHPGKEKSGEKKEPGFTLD